MKLEPWITTPTGGPPASFGAGPLDGDTDVTTGGEEEGPWNTNLSMGDVALVPAGGVTVTSTVPAIAGGVLTAIRVDESTWKPGALSEPKDTAVAPGKLAPEMKTRVVLPAVPTEGDTEVTTGAGEGVAAPATDVSHTRAPPMSALSETIRKSRRRVCLSRRRMTSTFS